MTRIAIVGAGNLGVFLASHLAHGGHSVFFCSRRPVGPLRVEGLGEVNVPCYLERPPEADIVLLAVKAYDTPAACGWLQRLCADGQGVAVIQNGVHHEARVTPYRAIPVLSYVYVEFRDGLYRAYPPPRAHFTVPASGARFAGLFAGTGVQVCQEADFHTAAWRKMLHNCVSNPLTAHAGRGLEILAEPWYRRWAGQILGEALPIAQADGAALDDSEPQRILDILASYPAGTRTSMLQDREQGKPLELDTLNGALVRLGRRYGLATGVNEALVAALSSGPVPPSPQRRARSGLFD